MVINRKRLMETVTVAVPFLAGVIVGKFGLNDKKEEPKKEEAAKAEEKKSKDTTTDAKAKG